MTVIIAVLFGLSFGSFACAAIDRIARGASLHGRSRCNTCDRALGALELVPVVSYLALRGRCAGCAAAIPVRTLAMELVAGTVFGVAFNTFKPLAASSICAATMIALIAGGAALTRRQEVA